MSLYNFFSLLTLIIRSKKEYDALGHNISANIKLELDMLGIDAQEREILEEQITNLQKQTQYDHQIIQQIQNNNKKITQDMYDDIAKVKSATEGDLKRMRSEVLDKSNTIAENERKIKELDILLEKQRVELYNLEQQHLSDLNKISDEKKDELSKLHQQIDQLTQQVHFMEQQAIAFSDQKTHDMQELTNQITELNYQITRLKDENNYISNRLDRQNTLITTYDQNVQQQINDLNAQLTAKDQQIADFKSQVIQLQSDIGNINNTVTQNTALLHDIGNLTNQNTTLQTNVNILTTQNTALQNDIGNLTNQNTTLQTNIVNLTNQNTTLQNDIVNLTNQNTTLQNDNNNLVAQNAALVARIHTLENSKTKCDTNTDVEQVIKIVKDPIPDKIANIKRYLADANISAKDLMGLDFEALFAKLKKIRKTQLLKHKFSEVPRWYKELMLEEIGLTTTERQKVYNIMNEQELAALYISKTKPSK